MKENGTETMKRLFNLYLVLLRTKNQRDIDTLNYEVGLLKEEFNNDETISKNIKNAFNEILRQYDIIYSSVGLYEQTKAEERVQELIDYMKKEAGYFTDI